jgi:hypothetical protein
MTFKDSEDLKSLLERAADEAERIVLEAQREDDAAELELHQIRGVKQDGAPVVKPRILKLMK